jgi:hypothetical protein
VIDLDERVLGSPEPPRDLDGPVHVVLEGDGLDPWQDGDSLAFFVPDDVIFANDLLVSAPVAPAPGDTALAGLAVDWLGRPLADVVAGDPAFVVQYRHHLSAGGVAFVAPVRGYSPAPFAHAPGTDATLAGTFSALPPLALRLAIDRPAFAAERAAIHPTRAEPPARFEMAMSAVPGPPGDAVPIGVEYPLVQLDDPAILDGEGALDLGDLVVPNPFPLEWVVGTWIATFPVHAPLPGGADDTLLEAQIGVRGGALPTPGAPLAPVVTPVRAPTVAGRDAFADGVTGGVGLEPELAWEPPAVGAPTAYLVRVIQAVAAPPFPYQPGWYLVAELWLPGDVTRVTMPAEVLRAGGVYALTIRAIAQPGQDLRAAPFRGFRAGAFADTVTSAFTP